jgi:hypothetical protein
VKARRYGGLRVDAAGFAQNHQDFYRFFLKIAESSLVFTVQIT